MSVNSSPNGSLASNPFMHRLGPKTAPRLPPKKPMRGPPPPAPGGGVTSSYSSSSSTTSPLAARFKQFQNGSNKSSSSVYNGGSSSKDDNRPPFMRAQSALHFPVPKARAPDPPPSAPLGKRRDTLKKSISDLDERARGVATSPKASIFSSLPDVAPPVPTDETINGFEDYQIVDGDRSLPPPPSTSSPPSSHVSATMPRLRQPPPPGGIRRGPLASATGSASIAGVGSRINSFAPGSSKPPPPAFGKPLRKRGGPHTSSISTNSTFETQREGEGESPTASTSDTPDSSSSSSSPTSLIHAPRPAKPSARFLSMPPAKPTEPPLVDSPALRTRKVPKLGSVEGLSAVDLPLRISTTSESPSSTTPPLRPQSPSVERPQKPRRLPSLTDLKLVDSAGGSTHDVMSSTIPEEGTPNPSLPSSVSTPKAQSPVSAKGGGDGMSPTTSQSSSSPTSSSSSVSNADGKSRLAHASTKSITNKPAVPVPSPPFRLRAESSAQWIECIEVKSKRKFHYHAQTMEISFETPPRSTQNGGPNSRRSATFMRPRQPSQSQPRGGLQQGGATAAPQRPQGGAKSSAPQTSPNVPNNSNSPYVASRKNSLFQKTQNLSSTSQTETQYATARMHFNPQSRVGGGGSGGDAAQFNVPHRAPGKSKSGSTSSSGSSTSGSSGSPRTRRAKLPVTTPSSNSGIHTALQQRNSTSTAAALASNPPPAPPSRMPLHLQGGGNRTPTPPSYNQTANPLVSASPPPSYSSSAASPLGVNTVLGGLPQIDGGGVGGGGVYVPPPPATGGDAPQYPHSADGPVFDMLHRGSTFRPRSRAGLEDEEGEEKKVMPFVPSDDPIEEILDLDGHPWDFSAANDCANVYRARAVRINRRAFYPTAESLVYPRYTSSLPLPENKSGILLINVHFFPPETAHVKATKTRCKQMFTTGDMVISRARERLIDPKPVSEYVLKVVGQEEYIYGDTLVIDSSFVRKAVRDEQTVDLSLRHEPNREENIALKEKELEVEMEQSRTVYPERVYNNEFLDTYPPIGSLKDIPKWQDWPYIPLHELQWPYRAQAVSVENIQTFPRVQADATIQKVFVKSILYVGSQPIANSDRISPKRGIEYDPLWGDYLQDPSGSCVSLCELPHTTKICFTVWGISAISDQKEVLLGWVNINLVDHRNRLISGRHSLNLWTLPEGAAAQADKLEFYARGTTRPNIAADDPVVLNLRFDEFLLPVVSFPETPSIRINPIYVGEEVDIKQLPKKDQQTVMATKMDNRDPLPQFTKEFKDLVWKTRHHQVENSYQLPIFLRSVDWTDLQHAAEARRLLKIWRKPTEAHYALELLDVHYADPVVREYAVSILRQIPEHDLITYLLQLTQCLKFEHQHFSALSSFLIERAMADPQQFGHFFFWHLKAELHDLHFCERFGLILEDYILHCPGAAKSLAAQTFVASRLEEIADNTARRKDDETLTSEMVRMKLAQDLEELNAELPESFLLTINPRWRAKKIIVDECKYMSSKKTPLWLVLENADEEGDPLVIMFKSGDDLRQDALTLQLLRVMDRIWLDNNLDTRMKPYECIATGVNANGEGVGFIEIVQNSMTVNSILSKYGGEKLGALKIGPLGEYVSEYNKGSLHGQAVENFKRTCAGYCVATYVLGIGDRHSDNIMVGKRGHLFHIDFGHFLGNWKAKFGVKRERSPFVFTADMANVLGGNKAAAFKEFEEMSTKAYNFLRKNVRVLLVLFGLMVSAGMPELSCVEDVRYLSDTLLIGIKDEKASKHMRNEIHKSKADKFRIFDNWVHMWVHAKKK